MVKVTVESGKVPWAKTYKLGIATVIIINYT